MDDDQLNPIEVPYTQLSSEAIEGLISDFIAREGTDYGWVELDHQTKISRLKKQLQIGEVKLTYDPVSESVNLVTLNQWKKITLDQDR